MSRGFEDRAADWIRFARAEGHDAYWAYRDAFFELLPPPPARALEVGCGEGRVTRDLRGRGYEVTGLDVAPTLVEAARDADPSGTYVVGDAAALPFDDASFDLVVSYNSLIDVDDMPAAVTEAGRVLRSGGCFCACVPHPFSEAGEFTSNDADAAFIVEGSYRDPPPRLTRRPRGERLPAVGEEGGQCLGHVRQLPERDLPGRSR